MSVSTESLDQESEARGVWERFGRGRGFPRVSPYEEQGGQASLASSAQTRVLIPASSLDKAERSPMRDSDSRGSMQHTEETVFRSGDRRHSDGPSATGPDQRQGKVPRAVFSDLEGSRNSKERSTISNPSPEIADAGLTSRFTPAELSFKGKAGGAGEEPTEGGADRRSGAKVASTSDATAPLSAPAGADPRSGDHTTAVFRDWHSTIAQNRSRSQHSPAETPTQRSSGGKDKDDTASAFLHENTSPVAPREGSKRPRSVGEKPHSDRYFSSQGLIDELGQQIIEERMVASRLQASLKAEQNALKLAHRANRQANSQVSRLTAEKQCLETEIVKLKTQLQMERRAWDADELHLSDLVQRLTRDTGDLRESIQRSERERRKLTETLNDERHIKECALNFITENNRK